MAQIIPALLVNNVEEAESKLKAISDDIEIVSVDVMDGSFVEPTTYFNAEQINNLKSSVLFELDLMVNDPLPVILKWAKFPRTFRAIVHAEIDQDVRSILAEIRGLGLEAGISLLPKTQISDVEHLLNDVDMVLIRGNEPGYSGRTFNDSMLGKIAELNQEYPDVAIGVDIGVNKGTIPELVRAGATHLYANSAIFKESNPRTAYKELQRLASE